MEEKRLVQFSKVQIGEKFNFIGINPTDPVDQIVWTKVSNNRYDNVERKDSAGHSYRSYINSYEWVLLDEIVEIIE